MDNQPLVSVAVIAYKSSDTIIETLDSIAAQTYPNIELIVADDGSPDSTVQVAQDWINKHLDRFVRTELITVEKNTGVTGNYIRAEQKCQGEWIKNIDGDDLLIPTAIADYVELTQKHPEFDIIYSRIKVFGLSEEEGEEYLKRYDFSFFDKTQEERYEMNKDICIVPPQTAFINRSKINKLGLQYDTRIPMLEDRPWMLNAIRLGASFGFLDKAVLLYRVHRDSLCNRYTSSPVFYESLQLCYYYYSFSYDYEKDKEKAVRELTKRDVEAYMSVYKYRKFMEKMRWSFVGRLLAPIYKRIIK